MSSNDIVTTPEINAEELMAEFDRESNTRRFTGKAKIVISAFFILFALLLFGTRFVTFPETMSAFLAMVMFLGFLIYPAYKKQSKRVNYIPWYDFIFAIAAAAPFIYHVVNSDYILRNPIMIRKDTVAVALGLVAIVAIFELCRRAVGLPILFVAGSFIAYDAYVICADKAFDIEVWDVVSRVVVDLFYTQSGGIFSSPINVCSTFIVFFIIFGAFLEKTGIGNFFVDLANSVAGWASGGPAKVAVISSALEGMYSGSSVANTVGSGSITIPTMKKIGYKPEFAAAVEAAASTGGQIMPPIMGAAAFLMTEYTGVPYPVIAVAAIFPAVLYFAGIFMMIHFEAKKLGLKGLPKESIPNFFKLLLSKGYLLLPIIVLIAMMSGGSTAAMSACMAIVTMLALSLVLDLVKLINNQKLSKLVDKGLLSIPMIAAAALLALCFVLKEINITGTLSHIIAILSRVAIGQLFVNYVAIVVIFTFWHIIGSFVKKGFKGALELRVLVPLVAFALMYFVNGIQLENASLLSGAIYIVISFFNKTSRESGKLALESLETGVRNTMGVAAACAIAGIISGVVSATGLGPTLISVVKDLSNGNLLIALFLTMITCIILGMGVPTTANYVIMATTTAPILINLGLPVLAAHMFVFYFGIVADITPPVALAAYAGSAIAGSNPLKTGVTATKLAIAAFIIPYIFALNPKMLMIDAAIFEIVIIVVTALIGIFAISAGLEGYMFRKMKIYEILPLLAGGILLINPDIISSLIGLVVVAAITAIQIIERYNDKHQNNKGIAGKVILVLAVAALCIALILGYSFLSGNKPQKNESEPVTVTESEGVDRHEVVSGLYELEEKPAVSEENAFSDVSSDKEYVSALVWAKENGIVYGYEDSTFRPDADITREQFAVFVYRYAVYVNSDVSAKADIASYSDYALVLDYARDGMGYAIANDVLDVSEDDLLDPKGIVTSEEMKAAFELLEK